MSLFLNMRPICFLSRAKKDDEVESKIIYSIMRLSQKEQTIILF